MPLSVWLFDVPWHDEVTAWMLRWNYHMVSKTDFHRIRICSASQ
jgi:hypothetical protein